jgi:hypothetical protein
LLKTYEVNLDIENELYTPSNPLFSVSKLDLDSIELQFTIHQDDSRMDLTGTTVELGIKKPSGTTVYQECEIKSAVEGKASIKLTTQSYIEYGIHMGELYVRNVDQLAVTSPFYYMSREAVMTDETIESTNDWSAFQQALFDYDKKPLLVDGLPTTIPEYIGQFAFDTTGKRAFIANEISETGWQLLAAGEGGGGVVAWNDILGKPSVFTPEIHTHDWIDIQGKPAQFPPQLHMHGILDVTGLKPALDGKAEIANVYPKTETYNKTEVDDLVNQGGGGEATDVQDNLASTSATSALSANQGRILNETKSDVTHNHDSDYADINHTHDFTAITGKPATYPATAHNHTMEEISGLGAALDSKADDTDLTNKADAVHTHLWADITDKPTTFTPPAEYLTEVQNDEKYEPKDLNGKYAFYAYNNAGQAITTNVNTKITLPYNKFNNGEIYNHNVDKLIAPETGIFMLFFHVHTTSIPYQALSSLVMYLNGVATEYLIDEFNPMAGARIFDASVLTQLNAGDEIEMYFKTSADCTAVNNYIYGFKV